MIGTGYSDGAATHRACSRSKSRNRFITSQDPAAAARGRASAGAAAAPSAAADVTCRT